MEITDVTWRRIPIFHCGNRIELLAFSIPCILMHSLNIIDIDIPII